MTKNQEKELEKAIKDLTADEKPKRSRKVEVKEAQEEEEIEYDFEEIVYALRQLEKHDFLEVVKAAKQYRKADKILNDMN